MTGENDRPELLHVDPALLTTTRNVRTDLQLDDDFVASIREHGVLVPIVAVRGEDGVLAVEFGHRRAAAAVLAGRSEVPVVVVAASDEAVRLAAQVVENQHRAALTLDDTAAAHQQMALLGVSMADAARATATPAPKVAALRHAATRPPEIVRQMDIETLTAFADAAGGDESAMEDLEQTFLAHGKHTALRRAARLRQEQAAAVMMADAANHWIAAGYAVLGERDPRAVPLVSLLGQDGERMSSEEHQECPGRAVELRPWYSGEEVEVSELCLDPEANGHGMPDWVAANRARAGVGQTAEAGEQAREQAREQRREVIENNKAWRAAEEVRRRHVAGWLAGAKPTPATVRWTLGELAGRGLGRGAADLQDGLRELGWAKDALRAPDGPGLRLTVNPTAGRDRSTTALLALVLADRELGTGVHTWRHPDANSREAAYLRFLADETGYDLGDVERLAAGLRTDQQPGPAQPAPAAGEAAAGAEIDGRRFDGTITVGPDRTDVGLTAGDWGLFRREPGSAEAAEALNRAAERALGLADPELAWEAFDDAAGDFAALGATDTEPREVFALLMAAHWRGGAADPLADLDPLAGPGPLDDMAGPPLAEDGGAAR